jgi:ATP adenylyltransferase/5',5'''-P-1,P-4-tetraphosphate phosphorylase II
MHDSYIPFETLIKPRKRVVVESRNKRPIWDLVKGFINYRVEIGEKFTRKDMLEYIYPNPDVFYYMRSHNNTADNYRLLLNKVEVVKTTDTLGVYIKLRDVPNRLTTTRLRKIAADKSWKSWFVPFDERL